MNKLKPLCFTLLFLGCLCKTYGQPLNRSGADSLMLKYFHGKADFLIAYTTDSFWWGAVRQYKFLFRKGKIWQRGSFLTRQRKNGKLTIPDVDTELIDTDSAERFIAHLDSLGFYTINMDSVNIDSKKGANGTVERFSISDEVNYKFEIIKDGKEFMIQAYAPEYFNEKIPGIRSREIFIKCRDWFEQNYKTL